MLLKDQIAQTEKLTVTDEDIQRAADRDATNLPISKDRLIAHYKTSESAQERLMAEKVMTFLREQSKITEQNDAAMKD